MKKTNVTWEEIIDFFSNYKNKEYNEQGLIPKDFLKKNIKSKKIPMKTLMFIINSINILTKVEIETYDSTDINYEGNVWRRYCIIRDFYLIGQYFDLDFDYDICNFDAWCVLMDNDFVSILNTITANSYDIAKDYCDKIIDLNNKIFVYMLTSSFAQQVNQVENVEGFIDTMHKLQEDQELKETLDKFQGVLELNN